MSDAKVERFLQDLQLTHADLRDVVEAVRATVRAVAPDATEKMMYGGILFSAPRQFCGVFAYSAHVSVEFGQGAEMKDTHGMLEGSGRFRRHIKLQNTNEISSKQLKDYIAQALAMSTASKT